MDVETGRNELDGDIAGVPAIVLMIAIGPRQQDRESQHMRMDMDIGPAACVTAAAIA